MGSPEFDRAAVELGHKVERIDWRALLGRKFVTGAPEVLQRKIIEASRKFKPDLVFAQTHQSEVISPQTYKVLRDGGAFVVNWCGDVRDPLPPCYERIAKAVNVMAFSNYTDVETLCARGYDSRYLQIGYDPDIYHPGDNTQDRSGVVFMANHYEGRFPNTPLRRDVAQRLKHEFGHHFMLYGSGWGIPGVLPAHPQDEAEIYRRSLVAINVDHFTRPYFASDRILRATASGCAVVGMEYEGMAGEHPRVVSVKTVDEMVEAVGILLNNPDTARYIGQNCAANTLTQHRWTNRINTIQGWMS